MAGMALLNFLEKSIILLILRTFIKSAELFSKKLVGWVSSYQDAILNLLIKFA